MPLTLSRRAALKSAGLLSAAVALPAFAKAPMLGVSRPDFYRFRVGDLEVTTILDGAVQIPGPHPIFGQNVSAEEVAALTAANFLPAEQLEIPFTVTLVNTGSELILFDTGNGGTTGRRPNAGNLLERMARAGYTPDQVDLVVMT
ncbi:MAG: MBL fold metallo-hydrolase, partial [Pseudomonadota bacterium]